jgi:hypothetical protein
MLSRGTTTARTAHATKSSPAPATAPAFRRIAAFAVCWCAFATWMLFYADFLGRTAIVIFVGDVMFGHGFICKLRPAFAWRERFTAASTPNSKPLSFTVPRLR